MKVHELIRTLEGISPNKQDLDISIVCENGLLAEPHVKFVQKEAGMDFSLKNISGLVLTWDRG